MGRGRQVRNGRLRQPSRGNRSIPRAHHLIDSGHSARTALAECLGREVVETGCGIGESRFPDGPVHGHGAYPYALNAPAFERI
jgi:hypothetical protein